jgi:hypothetical protein
MKDMRHTMMRRVFPDTIPYRRHCVIETLPMKLKPRESEVIAVPERGEW